MSLIDPSAEPSLISFLPSARLRRQEAPADPNAAATSSGLLATVGDTVSDLLHTVGDVVHGLPIVGGLGILSAEDGAPPAPDDPLPSPSAIQGREFFEPPVSPPAAIPQSPVNALSTEQLLALRQTVLAIVQQQEQAQRAASVISAASSSLPVDPMALQQRLRALAAAQSPTANTQAVPAPAPASLDLGSLLGGLPVANSLLPGLLNGGGAPAPGGLLSGLTGSLTGNGALLGGLLGNTPVGGLLSSTPLGGLLGGGGVGDLLGGLPTNGLLNILAGLPENMPSPDPSSAPLAAPTGVIPADPSAPSPSQLPNTSIAALPTVPSGMPPAVPPNTPAEEQGVPQPASPSATPPVPPPSPAVSVTSVPMGHDTPAPTSAIDTPAAKMAPLVGQLRRRRQSEGPSMPTDDSETGGFIPTAPDGSRPPLLARKRTFSSKF